MPSDSNNLCPCPAPRVLVLCAAVMLAGYVVLVLRGPVPAAEVRVSLVAAEAEPAQ